MIPNTWFAITVNITVQVKFYMKQVLGFYFLQRPAKTFR